jgi:hypothetical protein
MAAEIKEVAKTFLPIKIIKTIILEKNVFCFIFFYLKYNFCETIFSSCYIKKIFSSKFKIAEKFNMADFLHNSKNSWFFGSGTAECNV